jgi:hypothetical protein
LEDDYKEFKVRLRNLQKLVNFVFSPDTTEEEFLKAFGVNSDFGEIPADFKTRFYKDSVHHAISKRNEHQKKLAKRFTEHLRHKRFHKKPELQWTDILPEISKHHSFLDLQSEDLAKELFTKFIEKYGSVSLF